MNITSYDFFKKLTKLPFVEEIWLYGSRAREENKERSDIDLAIVYPQATENEWLEILDIIDDADTLYNIDCLRFDQLVDNELLRSNILRDKEILFKSNNKFSPWKQNFYDLGEALERLGEALITPIDSDRFVIDASIQRFEFCIELFWKNFKNLAEIEGREVLSPKQALSAAYQMKWLDDEKMWLSMLKDRNLTSHTYKRVNADTIYQHIKSYYPVLLTTYNKLREIVSKYGY